MVALPSLASENFPSYINVFNQIDIEAIKNHIAALTSMGSRFTGYPGYYEAMSYIENHFKKYGLIIDYHEYPVTIPFDEGAEIKVLSPEGEKVIKAYSLFPNQVCPVVTPPEGIRGKLVYINDGRLEDFSMKDIVGSIVLMNFNSQRKWIDAAKYGAKAVIFIEPDETTRVEAELKFLNVPFNFPRLYIFKEDGDRLLSLLSGEEDVYVEIKAQCSWKKITGKNIIGYLNGSDVKFKEQLFLISAHFDSFSVVPSVSPGATEAIGISFLLELVRFFKNNPPKYTIMFVAFSGREQGLVGSRWFVEDHFYARFGRPDRTEIGKKIIMWIDLDITSGTNIPVVCNYGGFYGTSDYRPGGDWKAIREYVSLMVKEINKQLGMTISVPAEGISTVSGQMGSGYTDTLHRIFPATPAFLSDAEPLMINRGPGLIITTAHDFRIHYKTPIDTLEKINLDNLKVHAIFTFCLLHSFLQTDNFAEKFVPNLNWSRMHTKELMGLEGHYLRGQVAFYNETTAWYTPVPNALVWLYLHYYTGGSFTIIEMSDEKGAFIIPHLYGLVAEIRLECFVLDEITGNVLYGPDQGRFKYAPSTLRFEHDQEIGFYAVFKCGTLVLFDLIDPSWGNLPPESGKDVNAWLRILRRDAHIEPFHYGFSYDPICDSNRLVPTSDSYSVAVLYLPENEPIEIMLQTLYAIRYPLFCITNSTKDNPEGLGYKVKAGEQHIIINPVLHYAENMYALVESRLREAKRTGLITSTSKIIERHKEVEEILNLAYRCFNNKNYALAQFYGEKAWTIARENYIDIRATIEDSVYSILFFMLLSIPFVYFFEKFIFQFSGKKRVTSLLALYILIMVPYIFAHPGVQLASDALMVLVGSSILILSIPTIIIILGMIFSSLKRYIVGIRGIHIAEISRGSAALLAFSTGIEYMKRRRFRTSLTLLSIIIMICGFTLFSSISPLTIFRLQPIPNLTPLYEGIFIKRYNYGETAFGVSDQMASELRELYKGEAIVAPRAWRHTFVPGLALSAFYTYCDNYSISPGFYALLGLTPQETEIFNVSKSLIYGRWFTEEDQFVCILSEKNAKKLEVTIGSQIMVEGVKFTVIGIVDSSIFDAIYDLDGERGITPLDLTAGPDVFNVHTSIDACLIIPYKTALSLGSKVMSISMKILNTSKIWDSVIGLYNAWPNLDIFAGINGTVWFISRRVSTEVLGWQLQMVPLITVLLTLLNLMLSNIYERRREINIYSVTGLSPLHISLMFLAESLIYALIGGLIGYLIALCIGRSLAEILFSAGITINFASLWVVYVVSISILVVLLSVLYPIRKASTIVTPSLERAWTIPTKPTASQWNVPLPFVFVSDDEVKGLLYYLSEFVEPHKGERSDLFSLTNISYEMRKEENYIMRSLILDVKLEPYERGISQRASVTFIKDISTNKWSVQINLIRLSGSVSAWISSNRKFIDSIRKQFLLWNTLSPREREKYIELSKGLPLEV
ncbi:MAG: M28 family peptidase [Candidatus Bathyarchaeia archaeon]